MVSYAAMKETFIGPGTASPCSSRSAINRKASGCTAGVACLRVRPYAVTPGRAEMSASQRSSSSRKYSMAKEKPVEDFGMNPSCHQFADCGEARQQGRSHGRQNDEGDRWHLEEFAYLVGKLRSMPEGDGTVLANIHKTSGMIAILAGAKDRLTLGRHPLFRHVRGPLPDAGGRRSRLGPRRVSHSDEEAAGNSRVRALSILFT